MRVCEKLKIGRSKKPWDRVVLSVKWWEGPDPKEGDGLETSTGRRYLILGVRLNRYGIMSALECIVLPKGETIDGEVFQWRWSKRGRRVHSGV